MSQSETNTPVIVVENVWKRFSQNEYRPSLRHEAMQMIKKWFQKDTVQAEKAEPFWALREISFCVHEGESVGIVGHNGAGKSTLFRVLCGVTEPTKGSVAVRGRFAPLLALGAGFNPELTGLQNIYLNGVIQGLNRRQIDRVLQDIIDFSELEAFIDLPVKRYSSGMSARLGFSVAVHTLPDIMFMDEILAVGDAAFQAKCRNRIHELINQKRTLLLVSHSPVDVRTLCQRAIWLDHGLIVMDDSSQVVIDAYEAHFGLPNSRISLHVP